MSDDLKTNTLEFNIRYRTLSKLNIMTDSYNECLTLGLKNIDNILNVNINTRMRMYCIDNDIICHIDDEEPTNQKTIKKVHVVTAYKRVPFRVSQKQTFLHSATLSTSLSFIDEELFTLSFHNPKKSYDLIRLNLAKFLSKKYSHNEYSYCKYFYDVLKLSDSKHDNIAYRQHMQYSEFALKTVDSVKAIALNNIVKSYNDEHKEMINLKVRYMKAKSKLSKVESYANYKRFDLLIKEYNKSISDLKFKNIAYNNANIGYNNLLIESLKYLLSDAFINRDIAYKVMISDKKYIRNTDRVATLKDSYKVQLKKVVNMRRDLKDFYIFKKCAAYRYFDSKLNKYVINGIKWNLKSPTGNLNDKTTLSSLQKAYNKVLFDKDKRALIVNSGL